MLWDYVAGLGLAVLTVGWVVWLVVRPDMPAGVDTAAPGAGEGTPERPLWASLPTAEYPPVPLTSRGLAWLPTPQPDSPPADTVELPAVVEPVDELPGQTLGEQVLFDPYAVLQLGSREVHRGCLAARRDGKAPCGTCAPVLTGPADSPQWRRPR